MTSAAVKVRQGQSQVQKEKQQFLQEWKQVIGVPKIKTVQQSCTFVKKLIVASLSNITYVRNIFDEGAYASKTLGGIKLKILREKSGHEEAELLSGWIIGAMDAIEKKYLRELVFLIYKDKENPEDIHEKYTFGFSYGKDGQAGFQMSSRKDNEEDKPVDMNNVQETTRALLRSIMTCTGGLPPLPKSAFLAIKLTYYDEVTPEDYEPEGFNPTNMVEKEMSPGSSYHVNLGEVNSKYHILKLKVDSKMTETEDKSEEAVVNNNYLGSDASQQSQTQASVFCVCGTTTLDTLMLTCAKCLTSQHGACYKVIAKDQVTSHYCHQCADQQHPCTDPKLVDNPHAMTCVFRRILVSLRGKDSITEAELQRFLGIEKGVVAGLIKKLLKEKVLGDSSKDQGTYAINKEDLESVVIPRYVIGRKKTEKRIINDLASNAGDMSLSENQSRASKRTMREAEDSSPNKMETDQAQDKEARFSRLAKRNKKSSSSSMMITY